MIRVDQQERGVLIGRILEKRARHRTDLVDLSNSENFFEGDLALG